MKCLLFLQSISTGVQFSFWGRNSNDRVVVEQIIMLQFQLLSLIHFYPESSMTLISMKHIPLFEDCNLLGPFLKFLLKSMLKSN